LARVLRRLSDDYRAVYGHRVLVVETFTDPARHTGTCYAAANFRPVGSTLATAAGRAAPGRLPGGRRVHDRLPAQREELPGQELPVTWPRPQVLSTRNRSPVG